MNKEKELTTLILQLEPVEFIGLARVLCIDIIDKENKTCRDFCDIFNDIVNKFFTLNRKKRREILQVLKGVKKENVTEAQN